MKKFISRVQDLSQRAAQLQQTLQSAPAKAAQIREAVAATTGQLQQLRSEVQTSFTGLRTDNDDKLTESLLEIDGSAELLLQAGYHLDGVDMDLGINRRLIVRLEKVEDVPHGTLRSLIAANQSKPALHGILSALLRAEGLADRIALTHLTYQTLIVDVGLAPCVRLCWRSEAEGVVEETETAAHPTMATPAPPPLPTSSVFGQSSFFERRSSTPVRVTAPVAAQPDVVPSSSAVSGLGSASGQPISAPPTAPQPSAPAGADWRRSALDRFKRMPDLTRREAR